MSTTQEPRVFSTFGIFTLALIVSVLALPARAVAQSADSAPVTFTKDVAPILQRACQNCHRPGSIAPMSLLTYEDARPWARAIKQRIVARQMPPWHIDKNIGIQKFKDDRSLTDAEIATIVKWVDAGAPGGNLAEMPRPLEFPDFYTWQIGTPDLIVEIPQEYVVPPEGPDEWIDFFAATGLTETRYVKALQGMPGRGAHRVVHHLTTSVIQKLDEADRLPGNDEADEEEQFLNEYAMGKNGDIMPDGTGRVLKPGSIIKFNAHYHSIGEEVRDRSRLGIVLYPKGVVPKYHQISRGLARVWNLDIPPGADSVRYDGYHVFSKPVRISGIQAHMHNRGKRLCAEVLLPTGRLEMLNCFNFEFAWHKTYHYADEVAPLLPAGTVLHIVGWHDNSVKNRFNPDPRNWVGDGSRTSDEMGFLWTTFTYLEEDDFKRMVEERNAKKTSN